MFSRKITIILMILASVWTGAAQQTAPGAGYVLTVGDPKAAHRIEVFYDLQCGACSAFHPTLKSVIAKHGEKVFVIFRHFPLPVHDKAFMASSIADAARRQGKGLEMIELLLSGQAKWSTSAQPYQVIFGYVDKLGMDRKQFTQDVVSDDVVRTVIRDLNRARRLEVVAAPTVFLDGKKLSHPESLELESFISKGIN